MARKCKECKTEIHKVKDCVLFFEAKGYCSVPCMASHGLEKAAKAKDKKDISDATQTNF